MLKAEEAKPKSLPRASRIKKTVAATPQASGFRLGLGINADGLFGKVPYNSKLSAGLGYGVSVLGFFDLDSRIRMGVSPSFFSLGLQRSIDGAGTMVDPVAVEFKQRVNYLGFRVTGGYLILAESSMKGWLDAGVQYAHPLSATQTDSLGDTTPFSAGRQVFMTAGFSLDLIELGEGFWLTGTADLFYGLLSLTTNPFGLRLTVAMTVNL